MTDVPITRFDQTQAFPRLKALAGNIDALSPSALFQQRDRYQRYSLDAAGLHLDYSKNLVNDEIIEALVQLAEQRQIRQRVADWLGGAAINTSENRPALHTLLRASASSDAAGHPDYKLVAEQTAAMLKLEHELDTGARVGCTGKPIDTIVNIGIGGSAMGVQAAYHGLGWYQRKRQCHFIVNIDPANRLQEIEQIDLERSLFLVSSKSFTTLETLTNYRQVYALLCDRFGEQQAAKQCIAVTANVDKARAAGFPADNIVCFPEWVGGRFSVWSAVGLPLLLCYGKDIWQEFLAGAEKIDTHLASAAIPENMPILLALLGIWQRTFLGINNHAVLSYSHDLRYFTDHLQQLVMESNGKSVLENGEPASFATGEIVWGGENSNGQHSYFQWLHQANTIATSDFIVPVYSAADQQSQNQLIAMALGQSRSLFFGDEQPQSHARTEGRRQSNTLVIERLSAETLGTLIALYEHKTAVMAFLWGINPFDQWGVEAGKKSATVLYPYLEQGARSTDELDQSTAGLVQVIRNSQLNT